MLVLGLLTLIMALVLPSFRGGVEREQMRASLRHLIGALRTARSQAATQRQRVRVFLDLQAGGYRLEGSSGERGRLRGMRVTDAHLVWQDRNPATRRGYIAFYGDGSSSGGFLTLLDPAGRTFTLRVEIISGQVILESSG
jgi:Tfp pilus assembly protein FimT